MPDMPLVSCIMPTRNRRPFVERALVYFARQDYPAVELVIVDDGDDPVGDLIPNDPRIRYTFLARPLNTGDKRNLACELARGMIIAQWDDDDWYAPHRLRHQVAPLLSGTADITGITTRLLDLDRWQGWSCSPALHRQMFVGDVHGGTLVFWRWVWERLAPYPSVQLAEDAIFQHNARRRGALLQKLPNAESFVYIRHGKNSWQFTAGAYVDPAGWQSLPVESLIPAGDLPFYQTRHATARPSPPITVIDRSEPVRDLSPECPLVTCIMPACSRQALPQALAGFHQQDYPNRELVIIDDGADNLAALIPDDPQVRYIHLAQPLAVGHKRNLACELARGTLIAHWDAADWIAPYRLSDQVALLAAHGADLCGANRILACDPATGQAWVYTYPAGRQRFWVAGNTLMYHKAVWQRHPFAEIATGEETRFIWDVDATKIALPDRLWAVRLLPGSDDTATSSPGAHWQPYPPEALQALLGNAPRASAFALS